MDNKKKIDIPFGTFDSELYYQEINIPDGFEATIEDNKIILKRKESEDERVRKALIHLVNSNKELSFGIDNYDGIKWSDILAWLEKQRSGF
jgi:hypothetical protein